MKYNVILTTVLVTVCTTVRYTASTLSSEEFIDSQEETTSPCISSYCTDESQPSEIDCSCDETCWRKQKCCLNYLHKQNVNKSTYYFGIPKADIERGLLYECHAVNPHKKSGYSVISKCGTPIVNDESWQWQKSLCEQPIRPGNNQDYFLRIPVSSYITGKTYKNVYCAACQDDLENIVFWNTSAVCIDNVTCLTNVTEALHNLFVYIDDKEWPNCELKIKPPPNIEIIRCTPKPVDLIKQCPSSFLNITTSAEDMDKRREIGWLCQVTSNTIKVNGTNYENPYCAACHLNATNVGDVVNSKYGQCNAIIITGIDTPDPPLIKSFPVLLHINPFSNNENYVGKTKRCSDGFCYDAFTDKCRPLIKRGHHNRSEVQQHTEISTNVKINNSLNDLTNLTSSQLHNDVIDLNCVIMLIENSEVFVNENGTLIVNQERRYPQGTFQLIDNETAHVCVEKEDNYEFDFKGDINIYMTIICCSLSLIALLLKMIIFISMQEIRKFPDRLVFCLCVSLFIAQLLFLTPISSITNYPVCASVGVLTHYFFLCSFCWMNVLAYDVWNTFSKCTESRLIHSDILNYRFYCYLLYAWVIPMLVVSAACMFEWSGIVDGSSIMRPYYGDLCWISRVTALLFYFAIPMSFLLITNILFFILTAVSICRSSIPSSMVQTTRKPQNCCEKQRQSPHYLRFLIYVRLAVIMGFTWVSGFVAAYSGQEWMWYVFTLTSASQGVYILIALTPFKTIHKMIQCRFSNKRRSSWLFFLMSEV